MFKDERDTDGDSGETANRLIKIGEVSSINPAKCTARVVFDDEDSLVSYDLPVIQRNTIENSDYHMPSVGEDVLCVFPQGGDDGFIVGSWYAGEIAPPAVTEDIRMVKFKDGTVLKYDMASSMLTATIQGTEIKADPNTVDITGTQTVNINGGASVNIVAPVLTLTMGGTKMTLTGSSAVVNTQNITFTGNLETTGDLKVTGQSRFVGDINATGAIHGSNI